ncbi:restriction endonuclease subunit S [Bradyrhizobium liaoningense]|uniref:restriction endonuclease subunit S n=1 Tax=Bradyrhizobium liaoningense TaxID=43992 RepID=UPI001BAB66BA|nr:restriction endonuclease subunit S [Bradyrhizobium liaoningense]MBR1071228.1 restriction endonuclease subunit S [Bradyrhizobium liaoningense]
MPEGWTTDHLGNLNVEVFDGPFGSHLKTADYVEAGIRVIRLENIGRGKFIDGKRSFVSEKKCQDIRKHTVVPGDIVFSSFVTEAIRSTLVPSHIPFAVNKADCFGIRFFGKTTNAKFVQLFLQSRNAFRQIEGMIHGVGRPRINTSQLKEVVVPICSPVEQARIVEMIDVLFSRIEAFDSAIENGFTQISTLRQSVLKRAFSGGLVPKDAADEPASVMLERIRAEQKEGESKKRRNSKNGKEAA